MSCPRITGTRRRPRSEFRRAEAAVLRRRPTAPSSPSVPVPHEYAGIAASVFSRDQARRAPSRDPGPRGFNRVFPSSSAARRAHGPALGVTPRSETELAPRTSCSARASSSSSTRARPGWEREPASSEAGRRSAQLTRRAARRQLRQRELTPAVPARPHAGARPHEPAHVRVRLQLGGPS